MGVCSRGFPVVVPSLTLEEAFGKASQPEILLGSQISCCYVCTWALGRGGKTELMLYMVIHILSSGIRVRREDHPRPAPHENQGETVE